MCLGTGCTEDWRGGKGVITAGEGRKVLVYLLFIKYLDWVLMYYFV